MRVQTRSGIVETVRFDKIQNRLEALKTSLGFHINVDEITRDTINQVYDMITTRSLDEHAARIAAAKGADDPEYLRFAGAVCISNLHKDTIPSFSETVAKIASLKDLSGKHLSLLNEGFVDFVREHAQVLDDAIIQRNDYRFDYIGIKTLIRSYLIIDRVTDMVLERPQHMYMRVAVALHQGDIPSILKTYTLLSEGYYIHATPTLYNSGTHYQQLASCFLGGMEDSIKGIYKWLTDCAQISKWAGGIGMHVHNIRATNSLIRGTNGSSNGIIPMLQVFNSTARYVDQCLSGNTRVVTDRGLIPISYIRAGDFVYSSDSRKYRVHRVLSSPKNETLLTHPYIRHLSVTREHRILTHRGWVEAQHLRQGDRLCFARPVIIANSDGSVMMWNSVNLDVYAYLLLKGQVLPGEKFSVPDDHIEQYLREQGHPPGTRYWEGDRHLTSSMFFDESGQHGLPHSLLYHADTDLIKNLVRYLLRDLPRGSESTYVIDKDRTNVLTGIQFLLLRCGIISYRIAPTTLMLDVGTTICNGDALLSSPLEIPLLLASTSSNERVYDLDLVPSSPRNYVTEFGVVHNGGGKRKGSIAVYLEPWHADIYDFLELKTNTGDENKKARDLFLALWIPDLFMERVLADATWSLFCPDECPGLSDCFGEDFKKKYEEYESQPTLVRKTVQARKLFHKIMEVQIETGVPYMCYKDAVNTKSNQKNLGTIKSSNLCSEIMEYSDHSEYAVCNLASINLMAFVTDDRQYDFEKLRQVAYDAATNLDRVIDLNVYPCEEAKRSNLRHRPIGLGVQGLADVFFSTRNDIGSIGARVLNEKIFETIYFGALQASADLAIKHGAYETYAGSPISTGLFQFDLWKKEPASLRWNKTGEDAGSLHQVDVAGRLFQTMYPTTIWDWNALRSRIQATGVRNSLVTCVMPTASTSQIMGNFECIEPPTSAIYIRRTIAGSFTVINKYLVNELKTLGLWVPAVRDKIIKADGSLQNIREIPSDLRTRFRTAWELPQKDLLDLAGDRGIYVDQSMSLNLFLGEPDYNRLFNMHVYGWKLGLKTGMYYLRSRPAANPIKFSLGCSGDVCTSCSA